MEGTRSGAKRNRVDEVTSSGGNEYTKDSLKGRWITVARKWIERNQPCTEQAYMESVCPLMPTHLTAFRSNSDPQLSATRNALARLKRDGHVTIADGMIAATTRRQRGMDWDKLVGNRDEVDVTIGGSRKGKDALREWLKRRGYVSVGNNVYKKKVTDAKKS